MLENLPLKDTQNYGEAICDSSSSRFGCIFLCILMGPEYSFHRQVIEHFEMVSSLFLIIRLLHFAESD